MTNEERDLITGLFNRLKSADNPQKDREAEGLIQQSTMAQPSAPYLLVQTVLVQEHALHNAQERIGQLEKAVQDARNAGPQTGHSEGGVGGFLSGLFGGHSASPAPADPPAAPRPQSPPIPAQSYASLNQAPYPPMTNLPPAAGGSFLKSALGTAAGVAGGAMLFQGIQNLLGHNAGPFGGGGFGGGGGLFGGGGGYGGPEIIENREVVNNYYDERGNRNDGGDNGGGNFLGEEQVGFRPHESNAVGDGNGGSFLGEDTVGFRPHEDNRQDDASPYDTSNPQNLDNLFTGTPEGDVDTGAVDNSYDGGNPDTGGGDSSDGNDGGSYA